MTGLRKELAIFVCRVRGPYILDIRKVRVALSSRDGGEEDA
jgi:hypothetical protein